MQGRQPVNPNTELLLARAAESSRWEDEERGAYGVEQLRKEFRHRLYGGEAPGEGHPEQGEPAEK